MKHRLESMVKDLNDQETVFVVGGQPPSLIPAWMSVACTLSCFCFVGGTTSCGYGSNGAWSAGYRG